MAAFTSDSGMGTGQGKVAQVVVEISIVPIGWVMTGSAICSELPVVFVILSMARVTIHGRASELPIRVTRFARHFLVLSLQFECGEVVIELGRSPAVRGVTLAAIESKPTLMRLIVMMAGIAVLLRGREVTQTAGVDMALHAGKTDVTARQLECKNIVIEVLIETVHTIMAIQTGRAKGQGVSGHEAYIRLSVTRIASIQFEGGNIAMMAVIALEWFTLSRKRVTV